MERHGHLGGQRQQIFGHLPGHPDAQGVDRVVPASGNPQSPLGWQVTVTGPDGSRTETFDAVVVANGHHWDARWPEPAFPGAGDFAGVQLHSHDYTGEDPSFFRDKHVVVLGMGNSAMDIAVESSFSAAATYLAARRGAWIIPKYLLGKPMDQHPALAAAPFRVRQIIREGVLRADRITWTGHVRDTVLFSILKDEWPVAD